MHLRVLHDFEKWRLLQLDGQTLAERAVENGVAGGINEIGEDDNVLVREFGRRAEVEVARDEKRDNCHRTRRNQPPS